MEYALCQSEYLRVKCDADEVVVVEHARYGRMSISRCVKQDFGFVGCSVDVLPVLDTHCSGRRACSVRVLDDNFDNVKPCHDDLKSYLEVSYRCIKGFISCLSPFLTTRNARNSKPRPAPYCIVLPPCRLACCHNQSISYDDRLAMLGLERLELRRLRFDLLMCYNTIYNHVNVNRDCFFTFATYPGTRGHSLKLALPDSRINARSHSFAVRIIPVWNNLSNDVVTAANIDLLNNRLSKTNLAANSICVSYVFLNCFSMFRTHVRCVCPVRCFRPMCVRFDVAFTVLWSTMYVCM